MCQEREQAPETEMADTTATAQAADTAAVTPQNDGVTSATYKANAPTFNGLLTAAPDRSSATVSMTMGGRIHALKVMQGCAVAKGQTVALLDNPEFVSLQQEYIERDINTISVGEKIDFRVNGMGKQTFTAQVVSIDQTVSKEDYSIKVYARVLTPDPAFRPGMYVRAKVRK